MDCSDAPFFSIIVPVFNVENYLSDAVESVLTQIYSSYEIILIDDGSCDGSGKLCDEYANVHLNVKVIHQENLGLSQARNVGIQSAFGKYIVFLDSDDLLAKNALTHLHQEIVKGQLPDVLISRRESFVDGVQLVKPCQYYFDCKRYETMEVAAVYDALQAMQDCWLGAWIFTVRKEYLVERNLFFFPGILHEDEEWVPKIMLEAKTIGYNNHILYCNRTHRNGSITATLNSKRLFDKLAIVDLLGNRFFNEKYSDAIQRQISIRCCKLVFGNLCVLEEYKKDRQYLLLVKTIKAYMPYLKKGGGKYQLVFIFSRILGVKSTSKLLYCVGRV